MTTMTQGNQLKIVVLKVFHGGSFEMNDKGLGYVGQCFRTVDVSVNDFCWSTVVEEAEKSSNYKRNVDSIFYKIPECNFEVGLKRAFDDREAKLMCEIALSKRVVECYVVLDRDVPHLLQLLKGKEIDQSVKMPSKLTPKRKIIVKKKTNPKAYKSLSHEHGPPQSTYTSEIPKGTASKSPPKCKTSVSLSTRTSPRFAPKNNSERNPQQTVASLLPSNETAQKQLNFSDGLCENEEDFVYDSELEDCFSDEGDVNDLGLINEKDLDAGDVDENLIEKEFDDISDDEEQEQAREKIKEWNLSVIKIAQQLQLEASAGLLPNQENQQHQQQLNIDEGHASEYDESGEEEDTPGESEDDSRPGRRKKSSVIHVDEKTDFEKLKWCVGIKFPNRSVFRDCVTRYAVAQGRDLKFDISDKGRGQRLRVRCLPGCPFKLYGSWESKRACFVVKSVDPVHNCQRNMTSNRQLKSTWVAKQFLEVFKARPHWPACEIIETIRRAYKVIIIFALNCLSSRSRIPQGMGILFDNHGDAYTNVLGSSSGPKSIISDREGPSTQASTCAAPNQA